LVSGSPSQFRQPVDGETIGVDAGCPLQNVALLVYSENPPAIFVTTVPPGEIEDVLSHIQPLLPGFDVVVERRKGPDGPQLRPHVFICAQHLACV